LVKLIIDQYNGIAVFIDNPQLASLGFQMVRKIEPSRQIIAIMEDFDSLVRRYDENEYLAMLDGESQIDNVVFVATTNYPERLDKRFVDRPSRFDTIKYIGMPNDEARRTYLTSKEKVWDADELNRFVELSDGFSVAHLRELIILTKCFKRPLKESAEKLRKSIDVQPSSDRSPDAPKFGFGG
jgi:SpoVK/Ycf46/Vps4 family AAA+-type ATPase